jgi:hypothetical protein
MEGENRGASAKPEALMITDEQLTVFLRYDGDIDGWVRAGTPIERSLLTDENRAAIAELLQRLAIVKSGQAADGYRSETQRLVAAVAVDEGVAKRLMECA